jgi:plasmid rolling circle replication initiator protein Rep
MKHSDSIAPAPAQSQDLALSAFSEKDQKWDYHRANTQSVGNLYSDLLEFQNLGKRMFDCSYFLNFHEIINKETGETGLKLYQANFCNVRHCPVCQWRRSLRQQARFFERIPSVIDEYPDAAWLFVTLTVKNPEMQDLRLTLQVMNKAFQRFAQRKDFPGIGYIRTTEITLGQDGNPHPHFHCLLMVKKSYFKGGVYLSQADWTQMWQECMRIDYKPMVNVKKVRATSERAKLAEKEEGVLAGLRAAVVETLKYSVKPEDTLKSPAFLYGVTRELHKLRFLATGGILKDFLKDEVSEDEMIDTGSEEEPQDTPEDAPSVLFSWRRKEKQYRKVNKLT